MADEVPTRQFLLAGVAGRHLKINADLMRSLIDGEPVHVNRVHVTLSRFVRDEDGKIVQHKVFGVMQPKIETIDSHITDIKIEISDKVDLND